MVTAILTESRLTLSQLARSQNVCTPTVWRWCVKGARGVKLESLAIGGKRITSREAFERFVSATNPNAVTAASAPSPAESSRRRKRAAAVLDRAGI